MSGAIEKTQKIERTVVPIDSLIPNPLNPNEMGEDEFNLLYDNIERVGLTDPILCAPHPTESGKYEIIGGEHRWEVAKLIGFSEVPITLIKDEALTEDERKFQLMRHNLIHGKLSPKKFMDLYQSLTEEQTEESIAYMMGFLDEEEFKSLVEETEKGLPPEMKESFKEAKKELKTIGDLGNLLNKLFTEYGDTIPHGYMIFDYGGRKSVWLRMKQKELSTMTDLGDRCRENKIALDDLMSRILHLISNDEDTLTSLIKDCPEVDLPVEDGQLPTLDFLD